MRALPIYLSRVNPAAPSRKRASPAETSAPEAAATPSKSKKAKAKSSDGQGSTPPAPPPNATPSAPKGKKSKAPVTEEVLDIAEEVRLLPPMCPCLFPLLLLLRHHALVRPSLLRCSHAAISGTWGCVRRWTSPSFLPGSLRRVGPYITKRGRGSCRPTVFMQIRWVAPSLSVGEGPLYFGCR